MDESFKVFSLILPILISGLSLIVVLKLKTLKFLDIPLDFKLSLNGKRIFGDNKTFRGVVVMILMAISVAYLLNFGYRSGYSSYISPVFSKPSILIGLIYSLAYILGELINSFIKRQINIPAGRTTHSKFKTLQVFFDLSDGIIVTVMALIIFASASINKVLMAGFIGIFLHYCTDVFMRALKLKH